MLPLGHSGSDSRRLPSARQSNIGSKRAIVCLLLDEVGLAEESPHLPLKVLRRELETFHDAKMSCFVTPPGRRPPSRT